MFNWTTTTLINELPHIKQEMGGKALRIGKHLFEKRWVESIRKTEGHNYELCEAQLDLSKVDFGTAKVARLYIYVGLEGSEESIYANDWYRKGMPLSVSFAVDAKNTGTESEPFYPGTAKMASDISEVIKKFNVFTKVKKVLDVKAEGTILTIKGTHEHQRLQKIAILVEDVDNVMHEERAIVEWSLQDARYADSGAEDAVGAEAYADKTGVTLVKPGVNGFGTYSQLIKDLRLPTAVHNSWLSVQKDEMPVVGELYTQYIITYYAPSTANPSFTAVGNRSMSETTHVFWVKSGLVENWEEYLEVIDPEGDDLDTEQKQVTEVKDATVYRSTNKKQSMTSKMSNVESLVEGLQSDLTALKSKVDEKHPDDPEA